MGFTDHDSDDEVRKRLSAAGSDRLEENPCTKLQCTISTACRSYVSAISTNHNVTPEPPTFPLTFLVALRHNDTADPINELECLKREERPLPRLWKLPIFTCQKFWRNTKVRE